uniref:Uncharacterized protein n=1 Tax=Romanomermis culicivorax TaxID=13658 RepID=A0A915IGG7_ROMCU
MALNVYDHDRPIAIGFDEVRRNRAVDDRRTAVFAYHLTFYATLNFYTNLNRKFYAIGKSSRRRRCIRCLMLKTWPLKRCGGRSRFTAIRILLMLRHVSDSKNIKVL